MEKICVIFIKLFPLILIGISLLTFMSMDKINIEKLIVMIFLIAFILGLNEFAKYSLLSNTKLIKEETYELIEFKKVDNYINDNIKECYYIKYLDNNEIKELELYDEEQRRTNIIFANNIKNKIIISKYKGYVFENGRINLKKRIYYKYKIFN